MSKSLKEKLEINKSALSEVENLSEDRRYWSGVGSGLLKAEKDVQEAVNDFHFLEWTIIRYKIGKPYDLEKLKNVCNKYNMLMSRVLEEDYGTTEMHKIIFGDWEEEE